jgi:predicted dehydrogenase
VAQTSIVTEARKISGKGVINVEAEDNAMVILDHGNGILSHIQCGFNYFDSVTHDGKRPENISISIWGTSGNMQLAGYDWAPVGVDISTITSEKTERFATDSGSYQWQQGASTVAEALVTGRDPYNTIEHTLHVLEIIEASRESAAIGKRFNLRSTFRWPLL